MAATRSREDTRAQVEYLRGPDDRDRPALSVAKQSQLTFDGMLRYAQEGISAMDRAQQAGSSSSAGQWMGEFAQRASQIAQSTGIPAGRLYGILRIAEIALPRMRGIQGLGASDELASDQHRPIDGVIERLKRQAPLLAVWYDHKLLLSSLPDPGGPRLDRRALLAEGYGLFLTAGLGGGVFSLARALGGPASEASTDFVGYRTGSDRSFANDGGIDAYIDRPHFPVLGQTAPVPTGRSGWEQVVGIRGPSGWEARLGVVTLDSQPGILTPVLHVRAGDKVVIQADVTSVLTLTPKGPVEVPVTRKVTGLEVSVEVTFPSKTQMVVPLWASNDPLAGSLNGTALRLAADYDLTQDGPVAVLQIVRGARSSRVGGVPVNVAVQCRATDKPTDMQAFVGAGPVMLYGTALPRPGALPAPQDPHVHGGPWPDVPLASTAAVAVDLVANGRVVVTPSLNGSSMQLQQVSPDLGLE